MSSNGTGSINAIKSGGASNKSARIWNATAVQNSVATVSSPFETKQDRLKKFNSQLKSKVESKEEFIQDVNDIHCALQQKELLEHSSRRRDRPTSSPIDGHDVTKEYRTKMMDWMVEVCSSFKCSDRSYFLSTQIFDKYLMALF